MKIQVILQRNENAEYFQKAIGSVVEVEYEEYVAAVVASEIGNAPIEACKAQAIAARTYAVGYVLKNKPISDLSSSAQAYRAKRFNMQIYPNAIKGAEETNGIVLTYDGKSINAVYSANNGGRTVSSKERWGGSDCPYLIAQDDPWDKAGGAGKTGHGVGMSQRGAKYAASIGYSCEDILSFYYHDAILQANYGVNEMIQTNKLIAKFQKALNEKWGYIYGTYGETWTKEKQDSATREMTKQYGAQWIGKRVSDCSGLFYWAFKELGGYMYHGSNTMYNQYCASKGKLINGKKEDGSLLKPGTAVFLWNQTDGFHHVGLYIGDGTVIEAKGTQYGVVASKVTLWHYWGEMKGVDYSGDQGGDVQMEQAKVIGGILNLRTSPNAYSNRITGIPEGTVIQVINKENDEWCYVDYGGQTGYVMTKFLSFVEEKNDIDYRELLEKIYEMLGKALGK